MRDGSLALFSASGERAGLLVAPPLPGQPAAVRPTWSPDGTRVAFSQGGIVVAELEGTLHRLTSAPSPGYDVEPTWSSDGAQIAFRRFGVDTNQDIFAVRVSDGSVSRVTTDGAMKGDPLWQPGGSLILFERTGSDGGVYVVDAATGDVRRVAEAGSDATWAPGAI
jgi:Tol biopolymer transport system component